MSAKHRLLGLPIAVAGNACTSCPAFATVQSVTVRFACATAKRDPSCDQAEATGAEERYESAARHCQVPLPPSADDDEEGPQILIWPSVEVVRSKGETVDGEKAIEVIGASCGLSIRVDRTKLVGPRHVNEMKAKDLGNGRRETHPG